MIYVVIGIGLLFIGIAYLITEKNAKYLLSGYNTMPKDQQEKVQLGPYLKFFRKFHVFLGISFIAIAALLHYVISPNGVSLFIGIYPILAYGYFIYGSRGYFKEVKSSSNQLKLGAIILVATLAFVSAIFYLGYREDDLVFKNDSVALEGFYGEEIDFSKIKSVALVERLPAIRKRTNGFSSGTVHKGYFELKDGKRVKLLLNSENKPYLLFITKEGKNIYYASSKKSNEEIYGQLKNLVPELEYNP